LFFALKPPEELARGLQETAVLHCARHSAARSAYYADLLHVSLICLGEYAEPPLLMIARIKDALDGFRARPFGLSFDHTEFFGGRRHLVLVEKGPNAEFVQFWRMLRRALVAGNVWRERAGGITPHMTIVYDCREIPVMPLPLPFVWNVDEFVLVFSRFGRSRHEEQGRWQLDPAAPVYPRSPEQLDMKMIG